MVSLHFDLALSLVMCTISLLRAGTAGSDGSWILLESLSVVSAATSGVSEGSKSFLYPAGMVDFAVLSKTLLKMLIP